MSLLDAAGVVTGDIWCSGAFSFESPLKDLLDSGEYTLEQLLAEDELLQELRGVHPQLIEFFSTEQAVTSLVRYITLPTNGTPPESAGAASTAVSTSIVTVPLDDGVAEEGEADNIKEKISEGADVLAKEEIGENPEEPLDKQDQKDALFVRYPYMSCEVVCCEIKGIIDTLVDGYVPNDAAIEESEDADDKPKESPPVEEGAIQEDPRRSILDLLFVMLFDAKAGEIDDYRAGYFDKILSVLFRKRPQTLADYINEGGGRGNVKLMKVMFKHLYSHSIMQIVQRLLLPQPPLPVKEDNEEKQGEDLHSDSLEGADVDVDGFGSFRCNWSESEVALDLLLECLIDKSPHPEIEEEEERRLSMYQNTSEVLITIIQNSPLTSPILHTLTSDPVLDKLIRAATSIPEGESFSPHDSRLTCTMNVLESLILQLGGYGSVATMMYPEEMGGEEGEVDGGDNEGLQDVDSPDQFGNPQQELATSDTLIRHLPMMLSNLCNLLTYDGAAEWTSPMQFSRREPQRILGSSRLRIVRLLESLVLLGDPNVDTQLCGSNCLEICLDLFWKFQWCSMLHQSVANLLVHVFEGANARAELQSYFLVKCNLLGRLMDSFWEGAHNVPEAMMATKEEQDAAAPSSADAEKGSLGGRDAIPVSEEDIAAVQDSRGEAEVDEEPKSDGRDQIQQIRESGSSENAAPQSFRLGYMGHVIIICQALVHACSNEGGDISLGGTNSDTNGELEEYVTRQNGDDIGDTQEDSDALGVALERGRSVESVVTDETPANPLILAQLVDTHEHRKRWDDFVQSTLASETAIQSTPLGGFPGGFPGSSPGMDPLHAHRPGLAEDDEYEDDDGAAPPLPPRGLLVGGDVIDMDDNDLDVAASMMAGLSMGRAGDGGPGNDQDLLANIPQQTGDGPKAGGYMFDDPLGSRRFGRFDDDDEDSSDEESELSGNTGDSGGVVVDGVSGPAEHSAEAPIMDLFAGNFEAFDEKQDQTNQQGGDWSDFANFDNAFEAPSSKREDSEDPFLSGHANGSIDDIFGDTKDHANLLEIVDSAVDEVAEKVNSADEDSSDEEDPVEDTGDTAEDS